MVVGERVVPFLGNPGVAGLRARVFYFLGKGGRGAAPFEEDRPRQQKEQMQKVIERNTDSINRLSDILEKGGYKHE